MASSNEVHQFITWSMATPMVVVVILFIVVYVFFFIHRKKTTSIANLPPGSFGWPFVGETLAYLRSLKSGVPESFERERIEKYGSPLVFKTSMLGERMAFFCGPEGNKFLFKNENKLVVSWWPNNITKLFGRCLNSIHGEEAKWLRKMMLAYLGPDALNHRYTAAVEKVTRRHIQTHWQGRSEVKVFDKVKPYLFEVACLLFLSLDDPKQVEELGILFNTFLQGLGQLPINIPGTRFYRATKAANAIKKLLIVIIKERRDALKQENASSSSEDLLSHLLVSSDGHGRFLTEMEIANNILLLLFSGYDTSAITIALVMKSLGEHPDVYENVLKEQLSILEAKPAGEMLNWDDIHKMRYSWNVVSEVMRVYPPVIGTLREALVDFEYAGYTIPKGWKISWSTTLTHREENNFPNCTKFDPSRFEGTGPAPFTYVPFGGGPRMCLGKELARVQILVFVHNIVTKFKWDLLIPDEKIEYGPLATPIKGLPIRLHPRQV